MRTILTFSTLHRVLAAEKALRSVDVTRSSIRTTPTPPGLSAAICGMALEILEKENRQAVLDCLSKADLNPAGIHEV